MVLEFSPSSRLLLHLYPRDPWGAPGGQHTATLKPWGCAPGRRAAAGAVCWPCLGACCLPPLPGKGEINNSKWASRGSPFHRAPKAQTGCQGKLLVAVPGEGRGDPGPGAPRLCQQCPRAPPKPFHEQSGGRETRAVFEDAVDFQVSV